MLNIEERILLGRAVERRQWSVVFHKQRINSNLLMNASTHLNAAIFKGIFRVFNHVECSL
jgi:hypothetical protein